MIEVYKYLHGMYSVPYDSLLKKALPSALRGHNYKLLETLSFAVETSVLLLSCNQPMELSPRRSGVCTITECIEGKDGQILGQLSVLSGS